VLRAIAISGADAMAEKVWVRCLDGSEELRELPDKRYPLGSDQTKIPKFRDAAIYPDVANNQWIFEFDPPGMLPGLVHDLGFGEWEFPRPANFKSVWRPLEELPIREPIFLRCVVTEDQARKLARRCGATIPERSTPGPIPGKPKWDRASQTLSFDGRQRKYNQGKNQFKVLDAFEKAKWEPIYSPFPHRIELTQTIKDMNKRLNGWNMIRFVLDFPRISWRPDKVKTP
jgi:hypothetical protein